MTIYGLGIADILTIVLYFAGVLAIGYWAMKRIKNQEDFFLAGRRFGKLLTTFAAFGSGTSPETAVGITTMVNTNGAAGMLAPLSHATIIQPVYWMMMGWYRRLRILTMSDFFEERYGSKCMAGVYAILQGCGILMLTVALGFVCMSKTISAIVVKPVAEYTVDEKLEYNQAIELEKLEKVDFNSLNESQRQQLKQLRLQNPRKEFSYINENLLTAIVAVIVLIYAVCGGLEAAFVTDMIQGFFTILLSVILIPFAMIRINKIGGTSGIMGPFKTLHNIMPESFFELFGSIHNIEFRWFWIAAFGLMGVAQAGPNSLNVIWGSAKDEFTARCGTVGGSFIKRYCTVIWGLIAMFTVVLYSGEVRNPDYVWGYASRDLLGSFGIGLIGLMIACLMSALMSTADVIMVTASGLLTHNVYRPLFSNRSEKHYVWAARIFSVLFIAGCVLIATKFRTIFALLKLVYTFNSILIGAFWLGMLWRRANRPGAWTSIIITLVFTIILPLCLPILPGMRSNEYLLKSTSTTPITRIYTAVESDVIERQKDIVQWDELNKQGSAKGQKPAEFLVGQKFKKTYALPEKSIFWQEGIEINNSQKYGIGMLKVELVLIDKLGFDLSNNSYALNETIALILRLVVPFGTLILVSLLTGKEDQKRLDRFYVKMKTPVNPDRQIDDREMAISYENPHRFDHCKLFPNSSWEFCKWDKTDVKGLCWVVLGCCGIVFALWAIVTIGG